MDEVRREQVVVAGNERWVAANRLDLARELGRTFVRRGERHPMGDGRLGVDLDHAKGIEPAGDRRCAVEGA